MRMLSNIASIARGSVGGSTFSANQFHQIIVRAKTAPVQPCTLWQSKVRSAFTAANAAWHAMTAAQQLAWIEYSESLTFSGPLGNYSVPGRQVFLSNYGFSLYLTDRAADGASAILTAPTNDGFLSIQDLNVGPLVASGDGYAVTGKNINPEGITVVVLNSRAFDISRQRYKGPFKSATIFSEDVDTDANFSIDIPNLTVDKRYFCSVRAVSNTIGNRLSAKFFLNRLASTTGV